MDLNSFFRKIFGIDQFSMFDHHFDDENDRSLFDEEHEDEFPGSPFFSTPNYFQQQLNDLLQQFAFHSTQSDSGQFYDSNGHLEEPGSCRNSLLKPGFQDTCQAKPNTDNDLDEKVSTGNLTKLLDKDNRDGILQKRPEVSVFRRSYITRTVRQSDGTYVTEKISRDEHGNEEKTVTYHNDSEGDPNDGRKSKGPFGFLF